MNRIWNFYIAALVISILFGGLVAAIHPTAEAEAVENPAKNPEEPHVWEVKLITPGGVLYYTARTYSEIRDLAVRNRKRGKIFYRSTGGQKWQQLEVK